MSTYARLKDIPKFPHANYRVNVGWTCMDEFLRDKNTDEDPEYQRGYVWSEYQRERYIEYRLRDGRSGRDIYWNCPNWNEDAGSTIWHRTLELVDGKQRVNAVRGFLNNEVKAFGKYLNEYADKLSWSEYDFVFHVNNLTTKREVIEWYLGMNAGGSIHTDEDLSRARNLLMTITE